LAKPAVQPGYCICNNGTAFGNRLPDAPNRKCPAAGGTDIVEPDDALPHK
jgi:hypothetical protein